MGQWVPQQFASCHKLQFVFIVSNGTAVAWDRHIKLRIREHECKALITHSYDPLHLPLVVGHLRIIM